MLSLQPEFDALQNPIEIPLSEILAFKFEGFREIAAGCVKASEDKVLVRIVDDIGFHQLNSIFTCCTVDASRGEDYCKFVHSIGRRVARAWIWTRYSFDHERRGSDNFKLHFVRFLMY